MLFVWDKEKQINCDFEMVDAFSVGVPWAKPYSFKKGLRKGF